MTANARPCGTCRHLDGRTRQDGSAYCWARYLWVRPEKVVADCPTAERADGGPPPGRISYEGERT